MNTIPYLFPVLYGTIFILHASCFIKHIRQKLVTFHPVCPDLALLSYDRMCGRGCLINNKCNSCAGTTLIS